MTEPVARCDVFHQDPAKLEAFKATLLDPASVVALAETFKALGDGTRVRILDALARRELCVSDIARSLDLSESAVSHQLRLLRALRIVRGRRSGRLVYYALDDQHVAHLFQQGLSHVQEPATVSAPSPDSTSPRPRARAPR